MSTDVIKKISDLDHIINDTVTLFGRNDAIKEEIYHNMWSLGFDYDFVKKMTAQDLTFFLVRVLEQRSAQIAKNYPHLKATFYLWYEEQIEQLRFNVLSGENIRPPFGCTLNILNSPQPIFKKFLDDMQSEHPPLSWGNITILNPGDPGWDDFDDDDDEDNSNYIQDVFVMTLPKKDISSFIKNIIP